MMPPRENIEHRLDAAMKARDFPAALAAAQELDDLPPKPRPTLAGAALWYAARGLPVFPLQARSKKPLPGSRGVKEATTDRAQVRAWWEATPKANIGLATGHGVDVIDFDGLQAHLSWTAHYDGVELEPLATVSTPRAGGLHVYVATPVERPGNRANLVPHVDYRGLGGYVVAPPSITDQGTYDFLRRLELPGVAA